MEKIQNILLEKFSWFLDYPEGTRESGILGLGKTIYLRAVVLGIILEDPQGKTYRLTEEGRQRISPQPGFFRKVWKWIKEKM